MIKKFFGQLYIFSIFCHQNLWIRIGSGLVFNLKCWIRIRIHIKRIRIRNPAFVSKNLLFNVRSGPECRAPLQRDEGCRPPPAAPSSRSSPSRTAAGGRTAAPDNQSINYIVQPLVFAHVSLLTNVADRSPGSGICFFRIQDPDLGSPTHISESLVTIICVGEQRLLPINQPRCTTLRYYLRSHC